VVLDGLGRDGWCGVTSVKGERPFDVQPSERGWPASWELRLPKVPYLEDAESAPDAHGYTRRAQLLHRLKARDLGDERSQGEPLRRWVPDGFGEHEMRAVILAAGLGTRLRPYTTVIPKPLVPIGDRPVLEHIIRSLMRSGVDHVDLCVNHLGELILIYLANADIPPEIRLAFHWENEPLGTAGALATVPDLDYPEKYDLEPLPHTDHDLIAAIEAQQPGRSRRAASRRAQPGALTNGPPDRQRRPGRGWPAARRRWP
jgi:hypothetical protein